VSQLPLADNEQEEREMKRVLTGLGILGLATLIVGGYFHGQTTGTTPRYRVARVERGDLTAAVSASGMVNPVITVQVGSQLSGQIKTLYVDYNSPVKKGQMVALIAPEIFESKVNQAQADLRNAEAAVLNQRALLQRARADVENARGNLAAGKGQTAKAEVAVMDSRRDLERKRELAGKQFIAAADRDTAQAFYDSSVAQADSVRAQERVLIAAIGAAEAQVEAAQAQLESAVAMVEQRRAALAQAEIDLSNTVIRAPVDGIVVSRNIDMGQTVAASLQSPTLFTIAQDLSRMQVDTNILEADIGRLQVGQRATFTVDAFPTRTFHGEVVQIRRAPQLSQGVVSYDVVVSAPNPELKLLPGMTANVTVVTADKANVLKVPNAALRVKIAAAENAAADGAEKHKGLDKTKDKSARPTTERDGAAATGRVHVLGPDGNAKAIAVRLGLTDGNATEVISDDLKEGQDVVIGGGERRPGRGAAHGSQVKG
jgi:HlyD family secretion protein